MYDYILFMFVSEYEAQFDRISKDHVISYHELKPFFAACGLFPSRTEVMNALGIVLRTDGDSHSFFVVA